MANIKIIVIPWIFKFFIRGIIGFTLKPYIVLKNESYKNDKNLILHESIHILQQKELGLFKFLILYIYYYLQNIFVYKKHGESYLKIPFEIEARLSEDKESSILETREFHWKKYIHNRDF